MRGVGACIVHACRAALPYALVPLRSHLCLASMITRVLAAQTCPLSTLAQAREQPHVAKESTALHLGIVGATEEKVY